MERLGGCRTRHSILPILRAILESPLHWIRIHIWINRYFECYRVTAKLNRHLGKIPRTVFLASLATWTLR